MSKISPCLWFDGDAGAQRAMAMMGMVKLDIESPKRACESKSAA